MTYEDLLIEAEDNSLVVKEKPLRANNGRIKGNRVAIRKGLTEIEKACVLAEELGHHHTTVGNILDLSDAQNAKQERQARLWAYNKKIGLKGILDAHQHGCRDRYEMAEYLEVTDAFLEDAVDCYKDKYGEFVVVDNYIIYFIPNLMIGQMI
ncbi:MAG: ImmA/IrrE family metallo-endopeptidase [Hespellia sp.]|nr:ImmA/IrrE family metallo-endopeptidase [Hespellia sp.]